jgi:hypothetical protein
MSNDLAVSMDELERESAELLPSRETLCAWNYGGHGHGNTTNNIFVGQAAQGGNTVTGGILSPAILDGNAVNISLFSF